MKKLFTYSIAFIFLFIFSSNLFAQQDVRTVDMKQLNDLKKAGKMPLKEFYINHQHPNHTQRVINPGTPHEQISSCNCWATEDNSWSYVAFDGSGGNGGPGLPPRYENDDWSTDTITLPFHFCFYGDTVNQIFINNNGNVSFLAPNPVYTADSFPQATSDMIAPFWGDCDTRGALSGVVHYKIYPDYLIIQWDSVGYYDSYDDKLNRFQLIITNGQTETIPNGNNVAFCYKDMQWTTGDASGGIGGFGGTPATVGVNKGDGINFIQIGRFDQPGSAYDGPYGAYDGIDALDNQYFYFNVCNSGTNIAPIVHAQQLCDTLFVCIGDSITLSASYLSPEQGQTTTTSFDAHFTTGVSLVYSTIGNTATINVQIVGSTSNVGVHSIDLIGTDDGTPIQSSSTTFIVDVIDCTVGINENNHSLSANVFPNPADGKISFPDIFNEKEKVTVSIINSIGKIISSEKISWSKSNQVDVKNLLQGVYVIRLQSDTRQWSGSFVKQ